MKTSRGIYYFPSYESARAYAEKHGLPTERIIAYRKGWAIQREKSGPYYGPRGFGLATPMKKGYGCGAFSSIGLGGAVEIRELEIYLDNDQKLYHQRLVIQLSLVRKMVKGRYDPARAPKLWRYLTDEAARRYTKEFGSPGDRIFSTADRQALAESLARDFEKRVRAQIADPRLDDIGGEAGMLLKKHAGSFALP